MALGALDESPTSAHPFIIERTACPQSVNADRRVINIVAGSEGASVVFDAVNGTQYYLVVDSLAGDEGQYRITVTKPNVPRIPKLQPITRSLGMRVHRLLR